MEIETSYGKVWVDLKENQVLFAGKTKEFEAFDEEEISCWLDDILESTDETCKICDGKGYILESKDCNMPASECCGGCEERVDCEVCEGEGYTTMANNLTNQI